jgi:hypothetical protein
MTRLLMGWRSAFRRIDGYHLLSTNPRATMPAPDPRGRRCCGPPAKGYYTVLSLAMAGSSDTYLAGTCGRDDCHQVRAAHVVHRTRNGSSGVGLGIRVPVDFAAISVPPRCGQWIYSVARV